MLPKGLLYNMELLTNMMPRILDINNVGRARKEISEKYFERLHDPF